MARPTKTILPTAERNPMLIGRALGEMGPGNWVQMRVAGWNTDRKLVYASVEERAAWHWYPVSQFKDFVWFGIV